MHLEDRCLTHRVLDFGGHFALQKRYKNVFFFQITEDIFVTNNKNSCKNLLQFYKEGATKI